jgi:hypothetical protein
MNTYKTRCKWCNSVYSSSAAFASHVQKKHTKHAHQLNIPLLRREPDVLMSTSQTPRSTLESASNLYNDQTEPADGQPDYEEEEAEFTDESNSNIDPNDLADIQGQYEDIEADFENAQQDCDSDVENTPDTLTFSDPTPYTPDVTKRFPARYQAGYPIRDSPFSKERSPNYNHLAPFQNARDYKLARFFTQSKVPKSKIDQFFNENLLSLGSNIPPTSNVSFRSGYTFYKQTNKMVADPEWQTGTVEYALRPKSEFKYRDIIECIRYLLSQRAFVNHMLWEPEKVYNADGDRIYSEMNTASWWWDQQVCAHLANDSNTC